jgi:hypothetical protein
MISGDVAMTDYLPEFETFPLSPRRGVDTNRFEFLKNMPLNAHVHFTYDPKILRMVVTIFNDQAKREGSNFHLSLRRVGENDPKGIGVRIIRDDKRVVDRGRKPRLVEVAKNGSR